jgi:hypothetical protein
LRRLAPVLLTIGLLIAGSVGSAASPQYKGFSVVNVDVNGRPLLSDVPPITLDGRTLVPLRAVAEALGATVSWDDHAQSVHVKSSDGHTRLELIALNHLSNQVVWLSNLDHMMSDMTVNIEQWQNGVYSTERFEQIWSKRMSYIPEYRKQLVGMSTYLQASPSVKIRLEQLGALTPTQIDHTLDEFVDDLTEAKRLAMSGQRDQALMHMSTALDHWDVLITSADHFQREIYDRMETLLEG